MVRVEVFQMVAFVDLELNILIQFAEKVMSRSEGVTWTKGMHDGVKGWKCSSYAPTGATQTLGLGIWEKVGPGHHCTSFPHRLRRDRAEPLLGGSVAGAQVP